MPISIVLLILLPLATSPSIIQVPSENLIVNGDFSYPSLIEDSAIYRHNEAKPWKSQSIEVGRGRLFNSRWPLSTIVCDLDGQVNGIVWQEVSSEHAGSMTLRLEWTAREGHPVETSRAKVYWNDVAVLDFQYMDWEIYSERVKVEVLVGKNLIRLEGLGVSDGFGVTVANVEVAS